jgi:hypothetical protein
VSAGRAPEDPAGIPGPEPGHQVWNSARELGSGGQGLASLGQGPVAILAGFDLATVVLLTTSSASGALLQAAIACFGVSAALFTLAMAFITTAEDYSATPDDRMMYFPEARVSRDVLEAQRGRQWQDENLLGHYFNTRVLPSVTFAVLGTLAGLILVLLSRGWKPGPVIAAFAALAVALVYFTDWLKQGHGWWLFPRPVSPPVPTAAAMAQAPPARRIRRHQRYRITHVSEANPMSAAGRAAMLKDMPDSS